MVEISEIELLTSRKPFRRSLAPSGEHPWRCGRALGLLFQKIFIIAQESMLHLKEFTLLARHFQIADICLCYTVDTVQELFYINVEPY